MKYRTIGNPKNQNVSEVSILGLGCMRLPTTDGTVDGPVDVPSAVQLIRHAVDSGVTYLDTAKVYHNGTSEKIVGEALKNGYREKVQIATKLPPWGTRSLKDVERIFEEELADLGVEKIDVYLLHCLNSDYWKQFQDLKVIPWLEKRREKGHIGYIGFSFHDNLEVFTQILGAYPWDVCQIQYNYLNETVQAGTTGLRAAYEKGISVIVMEPLFGGVLANPPGQMGDMFRQSSHQPVDLALRWIWDQPEVATVLSGMSNLQQLNDNLAIADKTATPLTEAERQFLTQVTAVHDQSMPVPCTKCGYCQPCPSGIDIPQIFDLYNHAKTKPENKVWSYNLYAMLPKHVSDCTRCGQCEEKCPQQIPICDTLETAAKHIG